MKFHLIAVASICVIVMLVYTVMSPKKAAENATPSNGHAVSIASATWGENCNDTIAQMITDRQKTPLQKNDKGELVQPTPLTRVAKNNVLTAVSGACNDKPTCDLVATSDVLGVEPIETCYKNLVVGYRCFNIDGLHTVKTDQGNTLSLNCTENSDGTSSPASPTPAPAAH